MRARLMVCLVALAWSGAAQTRVNLGQQTGRADLTAQPWVKPFRSGAGAPSGACIPREAYLDSATADLWLCKDDGSWRIATAAEAAMMAGPGVVVTGPTIQTDSAVIPVYMTGSGTPSMPCAAGRDTYIDLASRGVWRCVATDQWSLSVSAETSTLYAPGAKQTFVGSGLSAGLNLAPQVLPSSAAAGDIAIDTTDGRLKWHDGANWRTAAEPSAAGSQMGSLWIPFGTRSGTSNLPLCSTTMTTTGVTVLGSTADFQYRVAISLPDAADHAVICSGAWPLDFDETKPVAVSLFYGSGFNSQQFQLQVALACGDSGAAAPFPYNAASVSTAQTVAALREFAIQFPAVATSGNSACMPGSTYYLRTQRNGTDTAVDTGTSSANLTGAQINYAKK